MSRGWVWDFSSITAFLHCWQHFTKHLKFNYPSFSNQKCFWNVFPTPLPACVADVLCSSSGGFTWLLQRRKVLNGAAHLDFSYASLCSAMRIWKQIEVVTILKNTSESQWFLESSEFWRQKKKKKTTSCQSPFSCHWHFMSVFPNLVCWKSSKLLHACQHKCYRNTQQWGVLRPGDTGRTETAARTPTLYVGGKTSCSCTLKKSPFSWGSWEVGKCCNKLKYSITKYCLH